MGLLEWLQQPRSAVSTLAVLQKLLVLRRYCDKKVMHGWQGVGAGTTQVELPDHG
ncbi:unnamed protein product, partial [Fusarium fujikuroi]